MDDMLHELSYTGSPEKEKQEGSTSPRNLLKHRIRNWNELFKKYESAVYSTCDEGENEEGRAASCGHDSINNDRSNFESACVEKYSPRHTHTQTEEQKNSTTSNRNSSGSHFSARKKLFSAEVSSSKRYFTRQVKKLENYSATETIGKQENTPSNTVYPPSECANETLKYDNANETDETNFKIGTTSKCNRSHLNRDHNINDELKEVDAQPRMSNNNNKLNRKRGNISPKKAVNYGLECGGDCRPESDVSFRSMETIFNPFTCDDNTVQRNAEKCVNNESKKRDRDRSHKMSLKNTLEPAEVDFQSMKCNAVEYKANKVLNNEHSIDIRPQPHESPHKSVKLSSESYEIQEKVDSQSLHEVNVNDGCISIDRDSKTTKIHHRKKHLKNQQFLLKVKKQLPFPTNHCWIHSNNQINFINKPTKENCIFCQAERYDTRMAKRYIAIHRL